MSLAARAAGIIRDPRATFEQIVAAPRPGGALALLFFLPFLASAALFSTPVGRQALVDQWERTAIAFGRPVDDARYAQFQRLSERGIGYSALTALVRGPVTAAVLAAIIWAISAAGRRPAASYRHVLSVTAYAGLILVVRHLVAAPLQYARESIGSVTSLAPLAGGVDEASPIARFLALIDPFVVWWLAVLAIGLSVLSGRTARDIGLTIGVVYVAGALLLAVVMAALGGT